MLNQNIHPIQKFDLSINPSKVEINEIRKNLINREIKDYNLIGDNIYYNLMDRLRIYLSIIEAVLETSNTTGMNYVIGLANQCIVQINELDSKD